jgi:hypothetical protein
MHTLGMLHDLLVLVVQTLVSGVFFFLAINNDGPGSTTYRMFIDNRKMMRYESDNITMLEFSKSDRGVIDPLLPTHGILVTYPCDTRAYGICVVLFTLLYSYFTYFKTPESSQHAHKIEPEDHYTSDAMHEHKSWNACFWVLYGLQAALFHLVMCSPLSVYTLLFMSLSFFILVMLICEPHEDAGARNLPALLFVASSVALCTQGRLDVKVPGLLIFVKLSVDVVLCLAHASSRATMGSVLSTRLYYNAAITIVFIGAYVSWSYV